jgi:NAD(P)-dependent dehydrogenase (short-subunit alcohol dehydrogenase family)
MDRQDRRGAMSGGRAPRGRAVVTGAAGGMGRACARLLGATMELVLTDASPALEGFAAELETDGYEVAAAIVGDQTDDGLVRALAQASRGFAALVHTAGLPPAAPWRRIIEVNLCGTVKLLDALEPDLAPGAAAVLIASTGGYMAPDSPAFDALLRDPLAPGFMERLEVEMAAAIPSGEAVALGTLAYCLSKRHVIRLCETRAAAWGACGARIVSISPGMTYTPMGRAEAAVDETTMALVTSTPIGRWGSPMEIAHAAAFLLSPQAAFITGADLRVDGGALAMARGSSDNAYARSLRARHVQE